jgi:hypothetical protein
MREQDKLFVMYRRGPWNFTIAPRGKAGWTQFESRMVVFLVPTVVFAIYAESLNGRPEFWVAVALYLVWTLVWSRASIRWMKARAELIDVEELLKREQERSRRGGR